MIYVVASLELNPGKRADFLIEFGKIAAQVRAESGCIEYVATLDAATGLASQHNTGPDRVTIMEKWESTDALRTHDQAPHMLAFRLRVKDLVRGRKIRMLTPA